MAMRIKCAKCGSTDITRDALAEWDVARQTWVLGTLLDDGFCHTCHDVAILVEQPMLTVIPGGRAVAAQRN